MIVEKLAGVRIGIFGKGGAGKSTLTAILAQIFHDKGYKVCVLDADSTNFGLPQALGLNTPDQSLLEYYGGTIFSGGLVTCPVDDPTPLFDADLSLEDLPPECIARRDQSLVLLTAGKMGRLGPGAGCDGPVAKISRDFHLRNGNGEYLTLVDFKAGFEDSARGALTRLDYVLVVIDPTTASIEIASDMLQMVQQIKEGVMPATAHLENPELVEVANTYYEEAHIEDVYFILNKIPDRETESLLIEKLSQKGIFPIASIIADPDIRTAWLKGEQILVDKVKKEVEKIVETLEG